MTEKLLEVEGLTKTYPKFQLRDVTFSLEKGSIMGFIGRNGAGKTTTLRSLLGLVHPDAGAVRYFGLDFRANEREVRQRIGFSAGGVSWYGRKKLGDLAAAVRPFYARWDEAAWQHWLSLFELDADKTPSQLSEGMKVKLDLALALSHRAELLLLDEPTSGLDPVSREELTEIFLHLKKQDVSILFSTHITSDLEKCADSITYIRQGRIAATGALSAFLEAERDRGSTLEEIMVNHEREAFHEKYAD